MADTQRAILSSRLHFSLSMDLAMNSQNEVDHAYRAAIAAMNGLIIARGPTSLDPAHTKEIVTRAVEIASELMEAMNDKRIAAKENLIAKRPTPDYASVQPRRKPGR